ncbi:hypothetical protein DOC35_19495 [Salmonella enterica subsp. enterica]|nr:hypothetical protein [Salmonella enterica subsp. enterica]
MYTQNLMSRVEITALLGFKRTTFYMLKRHNPTFPPARGARAHVPLYDVDEIAAFLFEHAPHYLTKTPDGMKLAAPIMKAKGITD